MKKTLLILVAIIVIMLGAMLALPVLFKKNLLELSQNTLNKNLNAEVELGDIKLSLFKDFPKVNMELQAVRIIGEQEFKGDTLLDIARLSAQMNLASLFSATETSIEKLLIQEIHINLKVSEQGASNWELVPSNTPTTSNAKESPDQTNENSQFKLQLENIEIEDAYFTYDDKQAKTLLTLEDLDFWVSGEMFGNASTLSTKGTVAAFNLAQGGVNYIWKTALDIKTLLAVDFDKMKFTITENELLVNRLPLEMAGSVELPSETTFMNLSLKTKESDFENFLALVPPVYEDYMKDINANGSAIISGEVKGYYFGENYPEFRLNIAIDNGKLQYTDMPESIDNIAANVLLNKPQGNLDLMEIMVKEAHAEVKNNPVDLSLRITNPVSDPYFDGTFVGKVNLSELKDALPMDSVNLLGEIDANLFVKGKYSDMEAEAYDKIQSDGVVLLDDFVYESLDLSQAIVIPSGKLNFSPQHINLQGLQMKIGQSDFRFSGRVSNHLNYLLKDGVLKGNLQLNAQMVNFNELLRLQRKNGEEPIETADNNSNEETEDEVLAFDVPKNVDIQFNSKIANAVFDRLLISDINGSIRALNEKIILKNLSMNTLDGSAKMNGSYQNTSSMQPQFDFAFDISKFNLPMMYKTLSGVRNIMPVAGNSTGTLSSQMTMSGRLSPRLKLIPATANGKGVLITNNLELKDSPLFNELSGVLKKEKLRNVTVDDFKASFTVEDGNLLLRPFKTRIIGQETQIAGSLSAQSLLDMRLDFKVERELFGSDIEKFLKVIPGNHKIKMLPAGVNIKGPVKGAKVSLDLSETQKAVTDATKDDIKKSLDQLGKGLKKLFR